MIRILESPESWTEKYKIEPIEDSCPSCGLKRVANIPFADKKLRGFTSEDCKCGQCSLITFIDLENSLLDLNEWSVMEER